MSITNKKSAIMLMIGLGNPGPEYEKTRHNAGAWLIKNLSDQYHSPLIAHKKFFGYTTVIQINSHKVHLFIPATFMNCSGQAVREIQKFYQLPPESLLIAHDELDFDPGVARIKVGGGHGGHNGLRDIIQKINSPDFIRLRIGIGRPNDQRLVSNYVLNRPSVSDYTQIQNNLYEILRIIPDLIAGEHAKAMQVLHQKDA
ncbi:MAG: aminoacyl-tRNA hydrolase [Endozoicomonadaceae bacterium]|nr:aminoacyl-tRNA hydrolase [Endozoicomonadaceae bacterium]MBE8232303.1 aminoacyl-tRNA hydrolase [Endozoicomonadaceae bacterium]